MPRRRDPSHATPSEAALRQGAGSVALDVARAPAVGRLHARVASCIQDFVSLDGAMGATSDALRRAGKHADTLRREANEWDQLERQAPELSDTLDSILITIDPSRRHRRSGADIAASSDRSDFSDAATGNFGDNVERNDINKVGHADIGQEDAAEDDT